MKLKTTGKRCEICAEDIKPYAEEVERIKAKGGHVYYVHIQMAALRGGKA